MVDDIERQTEIDFFEKLPDALENSLESKMNNANWKF
jgi:endonuclease G